MKGKGLLIAGAAAAVLYALSRNASGLQQSIKFLQYRIAGIRFKLSLDPEIIFKIALLNPNSTAIPIISLFGNIKSGESVVASFNALNPITLTPNKEETVEVSAKISGLSLILKILSGQSMRIINVDGIVKTTFFNQSFNKSIDVTSSISGTGDASPDQVGFFFSPTHWLAKKLFKKKKPKMPKGANPAMFQRWLAATKNKSFKGGFLQYQRQYTNNPALRTTT